VREPVPPPPKQYAPPRATARQRRRAGRWAARREAAPCATTRFRWLIEAGCCSAPRPGHCPKCQGAAAKDWLAAREADLLPVGYFHLAFTLPAEIAPIAYQNKSVVYDLLFRTSSETLLTIAADPKHLGARIGITAVLHTWGSAMTHHPHVHMIVPGGGISLDGTHWMRCKRASWGGDAVAAISLRRGL
jgi:hypothetical protein